MVRKGSPSIAKERAQNARRYQANKAAYKARYALSNRERILAQQKIYYRQNKGE